MPDLLESLIFLLSLDLLGVHFSSVSTAPYHPYPLLNKPAEGSGEPSALTKLAENGFRLAPIVVVPAALEEHFYRLNNLPAQLAVIFKDVDLGDPDEDDVEDAVPAAQALLKKHYLLDEVIDAFYGAVQSLPSKLELRRADTQQGYKALRGRPTLMKLKQLWTDDWDFEAVLSRLESQQTFGLEARPTLIHTADDKPATTERSQAASERLGRSVTLWEHPEFGVTRVYRI